MLAAFEFDNGLNDRWRQAVDAHKAHVAREWPHEAGGVIDQDGRYHACTSIAADKIAHFEIHEDEMEAVCGHRPAAILHSHCSSEDEQGKIVPPQDCPSAQDMRSQMDWAVPWGISLVTEGGATDPFWFGDQVERPPLLGRPFRHGVDDCYSLVRDWHRQVAGIEIPDFVRDPDWWAPHEGEPPLDLYAQGFEQAGFVCVERSRGSILPGDCFICSVRSPVLNHAGVYIGGGLILHHLAGMCSGRDPAAVWRPKLDFLVRHRDLPEDFTCSEL
ncbi:NlpC/P60 family protein [Methylobacterium sp. BE186]|uniref:NlpC/P60 family protein n=1 Tax=Methylobacterium sp. BE186 TaxID=2817715 RepID=UPI00286C3D49|nr:NlpC/P60 family protein [Methylobacterium sp. BE186]